jgi:outer membrane cobalamin receptor
VEIMSFDLMASKLSMIIFENENLSDYELLDLLREYIVEHFKVVLPCHIDYIIDKAYEIYEKM